MSTGCGTKNNTVAIAIQELITRLQTIHWIKDSTAQIYESDDLLTAEETLGFPCIGVVYMGLEGITDSSRTGIKARLNVDCYFLGGPTCNILLSDDTILEATDVLCGMREVLTGMCVEAPQAKGKWMFVYERPVKIYECLGYIQRWQTTVGIT